MLNSDGMYAMMRSYYLWWASVICCVASAIWLYHRKTGRVSRLDLAVVIVLIVILIGLLRPIP
jgi:hypothetical protein